MARYGTKGTMRKFFQPSVSQLETHLLGINCMINKSLLAIAGIWDYIELPTCKIMILTILRCSYCFLSCLRSFDSLKSGISFQLKHKRIRVLHLLKWSTWKCKSLKTPRLVVTGKETNPWEYVTELPLMVAAFYPIFFFFQMLHVPYNFQSPVPAWSIFYIALSDLRGRSGRRTQLLQILTAVSTGYKILSFSPKF